MCIYVSTLCISICLMCISIYTYIRCIYGAILQLPLSIYMYMYLFVWCVHRYIYIYIYIHVYLAMSTLFLNHFATTCQEDTRLNTLLDVQLLFTLSHQPLPLEMLIFVILLARGRTCNSDMHHGLNGGELEDTSLINRTCSQIL